MMVQSDGRMLTIHMCLANLVGGANYDLLGINLLRNIYVYSSKSSRLLHEANYHDNQNVFTFATGLIISWIIDRSNSGVLRAVSLLDYDCE